MANGTQARIICHNGPGHTLLEIDEMDYAKIDPSQRDLETNKPGRTHDSHGSSRHAKEPSVDQQDLSKVDFAHFLAETLEDRFQHEEFDRLIIAAAPAMLGKIRKAMSKTVNNSVYAELPKDLCQIPTTQMAKHLEEVLAL